MIAQLPALRRYALGLTGNAAAADDLLQDCVERALRRIETLEDDKRVAAWLRSILFNLFIDERRRFASRGQEVEASELDAVIDTRAAPDMQQEASEVLRAAATLSPQHRQVLLMVGVEGLSYREVADEIGLPIGTVMSRLARARDQLRERLASVSRPDRGATPMANLR